MKRLISLAVLISHYALAQTAQNDDVFDQFFRYVEPRGRQNSSTIQGETVDLFTGTLRINHEEFSFPGKAGLDLQIVRSYSSKLWSRVDPVVAQGRLGGLAGAFLADSERSPLGIGWTIHFGRVRNFNASGQLAGCGGGDYPVVEESDGSARVFYPVSANDFVSRDFWKLKRLCPLTIGGTGICVTDTSGRVREYSASNQFFVGVSPVWPLVRLRDVYGNAISATYFTAGKVNTITDTVGRTVTFKYTAAPGCAEGPGCLTSIVASKGTESRTISYSYRTVASGETYGPGRYLLSSANPAGPRVFLEAVTPQGGPGYRYEYLINETLDKNQFALRKVTYPYGGATEVSYGIRQVFTGSTTIPMPFVLSRTTSGRDLPSSTWSYEYSHPSAVEHATTTVTRPDQLQDIYRFFGFGSPQVRGTTGGVWRVGLQHSVTRGASVTSPSGLETETLDWQTQFVANANYSAPSYLGSCPSWAWDTTIQNPVVRLRTIERDGSRYETETAQLGAFSQPTKIVERGEAQRSSGVKTKERSLSYDSVLATNQIIGRVLREESCIGASCLQSCPTNCQVVTRTFAGLGNAIDSESVGGVATRFSYYPDGSIKDVTNANGDKMSVGYVDGLPTSIDFGSGLSFYRTFGWDGALATDVSARGATTSYAYDSLGRLERITPPPGSDVVRQIYAPDGSSFSVIRGSGANSLTTLTTLDGVGRPSGWSNSLGETANKEYDAMGRVVFESMPRRGGEPDLGTYSEYDGLGRLTKTKRRFLATGHRPLTGTCSTVGACEVVVTRLPDHCVSTTVERSAADRISTTNCFESFGSPQFEQLVSLTDPDRKLWKYSYDVASNLTRFDAPIESGNRSFAFKPGSFFPVSETTGPRGTVENTSHDSLGQPKSSRDAKGIVANMDYTDPVSRLKSTNYPSAPELSVVRTYEGHLLKTISSGAGGTYTYSYDNLDRIRTVNWSYQSQQVGPPKVFETRYRYNAAGCLDELVYPSGTKLVFVCDALNRPTSVQQELTSGVKQDLVTAISYNALSRPTTMRYGNGKVVTTTYEFGRVVGISAPGVSSLRYTYDGADNVTSILDVLNPANNATAISYDSLERLRTVVAPVGMFEFKYDPLGNRTSAVIPGQAETKYSYDGMTGRLVSSNGPQAPAPMSFTWSAIDRVESSSDGSTYKYDSLGRRVRKTNPGASLDVLFHYDALGRLLAETDPLGNVIREYIYLQGVLVATQGCLTGFSLGCQDRAWIHTDLVGSVVAKSDLQGGVLLVGYGPWGDAAPSAEPRRYNGRWFDDGVGVYDYGSRLYQPLLGRFVAADTHWSPSDTQFSNQYAYVLNNPYKYTDPTGHEPITGTTILVVGVIGAAVGGTTAAAHSYVTTGSVDWGLVGKGTIFGFVGGITSAAVAAGAVAAGVAGGVASLGLTTAEANVGVSGGAAVVRLGQAGERAVREVAQIGPKLPYTINERFRISDGINETSGLLSEVKNVKYQALSLQLKDALDYARQSNLRVDLWVRPSTQLSKPLNDLVMAGDISVRYIPGTK